MSRLAVLTALLVACGDDGGVHTLDDAPLAPDAQPDALPPGTATVTVRVGGVPRAKRPVYFLAADGTEIATVLTGADGKAAAVVTPGSSVTTVDLYDMVDDRRSIATVMGVQPGDNIVFTGDEEWEQSDTTFLYPPYTGTTSFSIANTCGGDGVSGTSPALGLDHCNPNVDTIVYAKIAQQEVAYVSKLDQPRVGPIDLTGETWQELPTMPNGRSTYTSSPNGTGDGNAKRTIRTSRGQLATCFDLALSDGVIDYICPEIANTFTVDDSFFFAYPIGEFAVTQLVTTPTQTFDLADAKIINPMSSATYDVATRTLAWTETTTGRVPDFTSLVVQSQDYAWEVLAPYTPGRLTLPTLPGDLAKYNDATNVNVGTPRTGTATGGYDALRPHGTQWERSLGTDIARIVVGAPYSG